MPRIPLAALLVVAILAACGGETPREPIRLGGSTMGTTWSVQVVDPPPTVVEGDLERHLQGLLDAVNGQMSTWDPDSELSRFNDAPAGEWFPVSAALVEVVDVALELARETDGQISAVLFTAGLHTERVPDLAARFGVTPDALIPAGARPPTPVVRALAHHGVRWQIGRAHV